MMQFLFDIQKALHDAVGALMGDFAVTRDLGSLLIVLPLGIVFGAIHALTPGHSKIVLASYLVGSRFALVRGMAVAATLAVTHIGSAVVLAFLGAPLIGRTIATARGAPALDVVSRSLLAAIGIWLIVRALHRHRHSRAEGPLVGFVAGLVPCPLTLFAMVLAISKGIIGAGLLFAFAMMLGVGTTLLIVAAMTIFGRDWLLDFADRHGSSIEAVSRVLDFTTGGLLLLIGATAVVG